MSALAQQSSLAVEIALLPKVCRDDLHFWRKQLEPVLTLRRGVVEKLREIARTTGTGYTTVTRKFYALKDRGVIALVDRRLAGPRWWQQSAETMVLPAEDQALVKLYCEKNDRSSRAAVKQLRTDWRTGKIQTTQPVDPATGFPRGWSIDNLARYTPTDYELVAARKGTAPAAAHRRLVYTTRKDLWVGSHYMLDDMWHDLFVNSFAEKQAGRPLELFSHDLFSARKVRWGIRVRTERADGTSRGLTEAMTRYILAATLYLDGYSPRGTVIVAEHGTAAVNQDVEHALELHSGKLITVARSGMQGAAAHAGQYTGVSRGNPRMKASLEASNSLTHNVFAHLPGQTGKNRDDRPEQLAAILKENDQLLRLWDKLAPASRELIQFFILEQTQFMSVAHDLYGQIENDPDHTLEGWADNVVNEVLLGGQWIDQRVLMAGSEAEQQMALSLLAQGKLKTNPRRMTRREVWERGAGELQKLSGAGVVAILGEDLCRKNPERVQRGCMEFEDLEVGPGTFRFEGVIFDPFGRRHRLTEGEKYRVFINPFAPDRLFVCDHRLAYLGEAPRVIDPSRANLDAVHRTMGHVAHEEAERLAGVRQRHAGEAAEKAQRQRINHSLEIGAPVTEAEHTARDDRKATQRDIARRVRTVAETDIDALLADPTSPPSESTAHPTTEADIDAIL